MFHPRSRFIAPLPTPDVAARNPSRTVASYGPRSDLVQRLQSALADRYAIDHEVGSGGMATVYLAEDLKHHRKVAVKVLRPDLIRPKR